MEKRVKALHSELEESWLKPMLPVSNKIIKMGLMTLPLDIGPKLAVGQ